MAPSVSRRSLKRPTEAEAPKRRSDRGAVAQRLASLPADHDEKRTVMNEATYRKAQRTAASLAMKQRGADA